MATLADFKLAYRENLVAIPKGTDEESDAERTERAFASFRGHADKVLAMRHALALGSCEQPETIFLYSIAL